MMDAFSGFALTLRVLTYVGSIASAGAVLYFLSFRASARRVETVLRWQCSIGVVLLFISEPLRYFLFAYALSGNDLTLALSGDMLFMGLAASPGQASALRLLGALLILFIGFRWSDGAIFGASFGAFLIIASYGAEGHMAAHENRTAMGGLLLLHIAVVHWWFGAFVPLIGETRKSAAPLLAALAGNFGYAASFLVPLLLLAGVFMLGFAVKWDYDLGNGYQWRAALKIFCVGLLLSIAAFNKFRLTPALQAGDASAVSRLRLTIYFEIIVAILVLAVTSFFTATSPEV